jgi:ABC-type multidrug transport system fused ATPase/permease subunit
LSSCLPLLLYSGCYLGIYSGLGVAQALLVFFAVFALAIAAIFASRKLHAKMLKNILRSPMSFFDTTPLGRVLNRFSKDVYVIDEAIPQSARAFLFTFFNVLSSLVVIVVTTPIFIVAIIPLGLFYFLVQVSN